MTRFIIHTILMTSLFMSGGGVLFSAHPSHIGDTMSHNQSFLFKIKTKNGTIIDGVLIQAHNIDEARFRLEKRYPSCTIMSAKIR